MSGQYFNKDQQFAVFALPLITEGHIDSLKLVLGVKQNFKGSSLNFYFSQ